MKKEHANLQEASAVLGRSPNTLKAWFRRGAPVVQVGSQKKVWKIHLPSLIKWREDDVLKSAIGDVTDATEDELRRRKLAAETSVVEIDAAKARGEVVLVEDVAKVVREDYLAIKARVRNIPQRVAPLIVGERSEATVKTEIEREVDDALTELSNRFIEIGDEPEEGTKRVKAVPGAAA